MDAGCDELLGVGPVMGVIWSCLEDGAWSLGYLARSTRLVISENLLDFTLIGIICMGYDNLL